MSKKSTQILKLAKKVELPQELPATDFEGTLLEQGMYAVLLRELPSSRAQSAVVALRKAYDDYNEARVAQAQELAEIIAPKGKGYSRLSKYLPAARLLKEYLQAIFQNTHGLDLKEFGDDPAGVGRTLAAAEELGTALVSYLIFLAEDGELPVLAGTIRVLDRLGLMTRTNSVRKAREALQGAIPPKDRLLVAFALGLVADRWCDSRKPACWDCVLLEECPNGKKVHKEWKVQQERLAKQRAKEEARAEAQAKKEAARLARDAEREAKARAAAEAKAKRDQERAERDAARKKEAERKRKEAEKKRQEAAKQAAAKKATGKKKSAKKAPSSKAAKSKPARKAAKKKATPKKTTQKKAAAKKAPKKAAKKTAKKAAKKKTARKSTRKTGRKTAPRRK